MNAKKLCLTVLAALSLWACAVEPVAPNTRPIILDTSYTRYCDNGMLFGGGRVVFPKGVYQPSFQTEAGVFYEAPTFLIGAVPARGGLFIPHDPSGKQACWFEPAFFQLSTVRGEPIPYHH